ncbi:MAG: DUF2752 domain-containing protein [Candidatus Nanopelagicales bacterium]|nr:DUF2752 domain-containing protein [Candidatus Nanopelagicales bacterium]
MSPVKVLDQQPKERTRTVTRLRLSIALVAVLALVFGYLARYHEDILLGHTLCPVLATTGYRCPFCGGSQSAVSLVQGDWITAAKANLLIATGPVFLVLGLMLKRTWDSMPAQRRRVEVAAMASLPIVITVWSLSRNLYGI